MGVALKCKTKKITTFIHTSLKPTWGFAFNSDLPRFPMFFFSSMAHIWYTKDFWIPECESNTGECSCQWAPSPTKPSPMFKAMAESMSQMVTLNQCKASTIFFSTLSTMCRPRPELSTSCCLILNHNIWPPCLVPCMFRPIKFSFQRGLVWDRMLTLKTLQNWVHCLGKWITP